MQQEAVNPRCPYCTKESYLVNGVAIYPHRKDLASKPFYACLKCDAYVGCHPNTKKPLGRLANKTLRRLKMSAHSAFDPIWKYDGEDRSDAYKWLAIQMGIPFDQCHIGMFDEDQCQLVVDLCNKRRANERGNRAQVRSVR